MRIFSTDKTHRALFYYLLSLNNSGFHLEVHLCFNVWHKALKSIRLLKRIVRQLQTCNFVSNQGAPSVMFCSKYIIGKNCWGGISIASTFKNIRWTQMPSYIFNESCCFITCTYKKYENEGHKRTAFLIDFPKHLLYLTAFQIFLC